MINAKQAELPLNSGKKFPVGIHAKCKVTSVEVGENFIDFNYESADGSYYHNKRVWFPDIKKVYPKKIKQPNGVEIQETPAMALKRDTNERLGHIVKHMHIFMTPAEIDALEAPDFASYATKVASILTPARLATKFVNLMLIYDSDGAYSTFGNYPTYIEEYVEGEEPTLKPSKWELENRWTPKAQPNVGSTGTSSPSSGIF